MSAIPVIQPSFAAGELSPFLYGRVDLAKFHVGARTLQNFFVHAHGGVSNRPGTRFIGEVDDSSARHRLIPFQFRTLPAGQTYVLVFGDKTMQVAMQSGAKSAASWGFVTEAPRQIQAITRANPGVIEIDGHGFATGDRILLSGIAGMTRLNGRTVTVTVIDGNLVSIGIDTTGFDPWVSGGAAARLFSLPTPYADADLPLLKYVQSADTMTLTHPKYSARKLTRAGHALWSLTPITFAPSTQPPTGLASTSGGSAAFVVVTAINDSTGEESLPCSAAGSSNGSGGTWTWNAVNGCTNYNVYKNKGSMYGFVAQVQTNSWTDSNLDPDISNTPPGSRTPFGTNLLTSLMVQSGGSGYNSPTGKVIDGGRTVTTVTFGLTGGAITSASLADTTRQASANAFVQITDGAGSGAILAPVFPGDGTMQAQVVGAGSSYGVNTHVDMLVGAVLNPWGYTFVVHRDAGGAITSVDVNQGTPVDPGYWSQIQLLVTDSAGSGAVVTTNLTNQPDSGQSNPGCTTYFMQRQVFADTTNQPQTLWFTAVGAFGNMNVSTPTRDDDAITRTLTGRQVNEVRHLVPVGSSMLVMTSGAEWRCWPGPSSNALTPGACYTLPQTAHGSSHVPPIQAGNDVLFIKEKGSRVVALRFDAIQDQYQSFDMSILSSHLLYDSSGAHRIVEWALAAEPHQIIWAARDDGVLLGFTYMREHDVYAWHRHITDGAVESVTTVTEADGYGGYEDAVWLIVNRPIGPEGNGRTCRYLERMVSRTFPTVADAWFVDCGLVYDGNPVTEVNGLDHLEGKTVAILGDGSVVPSQVVTGGAVPLDGAYSKVVVGLPYTADLETLNLELATPAGPTAQGQMKKTGQVTVRVKEARGLGVGLSQGALAEVKQRSQETLGTALQPFSGDWQISVPSEWNRDGRIFVRQSYPLPATILDLIPEVNIGS
ncbi:MAG TPA: ubiquitin-activating E1 FCCH domain-containing protein [Reyranella sp.]